MRSYRRRPRLPSLWRRAVIGKVSAAASGLPATVLAIMLLWAVANVQRYLTSIYLGASTLLDDFNITATAAGLLAAVYFPVYGLVQLPSGVVADHRSPKRILLYSSLLVFGSSLAFAIAPTLELAVAARAVVGFGSGFVWLASLKLFLLAGREQYSRLIGALVAAGNVGGMLALLVLPGLLEVWSWRTMTVVTVAPALVLFLVLLLTPVPEPPRAPGTLLSAMAKGLQASLALLRDLRFWPIFLPAIVWNGAHFGLVTWLPRYARDVLGQERAAVGTLAALIPLGLVLASYTTGWLYQRVGGRGARVFYGFGIAYVVTLGSLGLFSVMATSAILLYAATLALGVLFSGYFISMSLLVEFVPEERLGTATGVLNGGSFGPAFVTPWLMGFVLDLVDRPTSPGWTYSHVAFGAALAVLLLLMAGSLLAAWWLSRLATARQ